MQTNIAEAVARLRKMAAEAVQQYSDEVFAGGEPVFPDWTRDVVTVCDAVDIMDRTLLVAMATA